MDIPVVPSLPTSLQGCAGGTHVVGLDAQGTQRSLLEHRVEMALGIPQNPANPRFQHGLSLAIQSFLLCCVWIWQLDNAEGLLLALLSLPAPCCFFGSFDWFLSS